MARLERRGSSELMVELSVAAVTVCALSFWFISFDLFEFWYDFTRDHEDWQLDERLAVVIALLVTGTILAIRHAYVLLDLSKNLADANVHIAVQARTQLQQEKLAAPGQLAGGMAHETSNALQPALGLGALVEDGLRKNGHTNHLEYMGLILTSATHAQAIVESVLDFTREKNVDMSNHEALDVLTQALNFATSIMPKTIAFEISKPRETGSPPLFLRCNKTNLMQVFVNILKNAGYAMNEAGTIRISIAHAMLPKEPHAPALAVSIADTGCGMEKHDVDRVFDPFFTTKDASEGTGLGLSSAHGIIHNHGGEISVQSTPGQGSVFTIYFPIARDSEQKEFNEGRM